MTTTTAPTTAEADLATVRALFETFANGDLPGFAERLRPDAVWNHRNPDRLGGIHRAPDGIVAFLGESVQLTEGTLRAEPQIMMGDGAGHVAVVVRISGRRPDGRAFDDKQVLLLAVEGDRVRSIDQYIGDPPAVTAFWA
jgi:ketosteroid isomerase-like protein